MNIYVFNRLIRACLFMDGSNNRSEAAFTQLVFNLILVNYYIKRELLSYLYKFKINCV